LLDSENKSHSHKSNSFVLLVAICQRTRGNNPKTSNFHIWFPLDINHFVFEAAANFVYDMRYDMIYLTAIGLPRGGNPIANS
jgi:hypothetical protein